MAFLSSVVQGIIDNKWVVLFYAAIIFFIIVRRKRFEFQAKIIALYRTNFGIGMINRIGTRHSELIKLIGYCGIGVGFIGMGLILFMMGKGLWDLLFIPEAPPVISPVLPGVQIPGSPVFVPFVYGIISLFIVVLIHEFSHGIVAKAHGITVKSTGFFFAGPIIGAFVEPDDKQMLKKGDVVNYSVAAAGPFSNVITAGIVIAIMAAVLTPLTNHLAAPQGVVFTNVEDGFPAQKAGIEEGVLYDFANNQSVSDVSEFEAALKGLEVGDYVMVGNSQNKYLIQTTSRPESPDKAVIGVNVRTKYANEDEWWLKSLLWLDQLFFWIFVLSIGLGLANLLPLGPIDGGVMIRQALQKVKGEKAGLRAWMKLTVFMLVILLILVFIPIIKAVI